MIGLMVYGHCGLYVAVVGGWRRNWSQHRREKAFDRVGRDLPAGPAEDVVAPVRGPGQPQEQVRYLRAKQPVRQELSMKRRDELIA